MSAPAPRFNATNHIARVVTGTGMGDTFQARTNNDAAMIVILEARLKELTNALARGGKGGKNKLREALNTLPAPDGLNALNVYYEINKVL